MGVGMGNMLKYSVFFGVLGVAIIFGLGGCKKDDAVYTTAEVKRGDVVQKITASGTINPISTVNIGTQVSGIIEEIYVDFNSNVKKGQLLAVIDPQTFEASVDQKQAALNIAKAELEVTKNDIVYYKKHLDRIKKLNTSKYSTDKELETAQRDYDNSIAQKALREAQVLQAEATLKQAKIDLEYTKIISSVDGVVISREVEVGQTVAASFETPVLFNVAEDLTKMQIEATVVEADISKVKEGQKVLFNVDSFPNETFEGVVTQVRNEAVTTSNVVTYEVVISVNNLEHKFKPGMTANVEIITANEKDILVVPNKALRFSMGDDIRYQQKGVWILKDGKPQRINVIAGVYDDNNTQITSNELHEGTEIIVEKADTVQRSGRKMPMRMR